MAGLTSLTKIPGCIQIEPPLHRDNRGFFTKPISDSVRRAIDTNFSIAEIYWSFSHRGVVRGLHFQLPPTSVEKVVWVTEGTIRDIVLDLRVGSTTFGEHVAFELDNEGGAIFVPNGCAHGFEVLTDSATVIYAQDLAFDPVTDSGVHWDSAGVQWITEEPTVSSRDAGLPQLESFDSPFQYLGSAT